jgi:hypothetical protein
MRPHPLVEPSPLEAVPEPHVIRARIALLMREQMILRKLLKVSEDKQRDLPAEEVSRAG